MNKFLIILGLILIISAGIFLSIKSKSRSTSEPTQQQEITPSESEPVPLPTGKDVIQTFFDLIHTNEIIPAIEMLSKDFVPNENTKQKIGVLFNSFTAIQPLEIKPYQKENWTDNTQKYEVTLDVGLSLDNEQWVLQNYGWYTGENKRWIKLTKENNLWKIAVIATGP